MSSQKIEAAQRTIYRSVLGGSYEVTINVPDAVHGSFSDLALLRATTETQVARQMRIMQLDRLYTRHFFDLTLRKDQSAVPSDSDGEAIVRTFKPTFSSSPR
jgi:hypothetical protein